MKKKILKKILIIVIIICVSYFVIECIRGITGMNPLIILNTEKSTTYERIVTKKTHGLIFSSYVSYSKGLSIGGVYRENKLFDIITIWKMTAE